MNEDIMASTYASDALLHARDSVPLYGVPPPQKNQENLEESNQV